MNGDEAVHARGGAHAPDATAAPTSALPPPTQDAELERFLRGQDTVPIVQLQPCALRLPATLFPPGHAHLLGCTPDNMVECRFKKRVSHTSGSISLILKKRFRFTQVADVNLGGIMCLDRAPSLLPLLYRVLLPDACVRPFLFCRINGALYTLREAYVGGIGNLWTATRPLDNTIFLATILFNDLIHKSRNLHVYSVRDSLQVMADVGDARGRYDACADPATVQEYAAFYRRWRMQTIRRLTAALGALGTEQADPERVRLVADLVRELKDRQTT